MTGSELLPGTTAQIEGSARTLTYLDGSHVSVALTADDLLYATQRTLVLMNAASGGGSTGPLTLSVVNYSKKAAAYTAYGDSITFGYTLDSVLLAYPYQLAKANSLVVNDAAKIGDQACDLFPHQIYPARDGYGATAAGQVYSLLIGTNDVNEHRGTTTYDALFQTCHQAAMAWLALPRGSKVLPGDAALSVSGGCANHADGGHMGVAYCTAAGSITDTSFASYGKALYVWYLIDDNAGTAARFALQVDGVAAGTLSAVTAVPISTMNASTASIALMRVPVPAEFHTVTLAATGGGVGLLGLGTVPASLSGLSFLVAGDLPVQLLSGPYAPPVSQQQYSADIRADVAVLQGDGLDIRFAPTRQFMTGSAAEMTDAFPPNLLGHMHLAAAFQTGFNGVNGDGPAAMERERVGALARQP